VLALGLVIALGQMTWAQDTKSGSISGTVTAKDGKAAANVAVKVIKAPEAAQGDAKDAGGDKKHESRKEKKLNTVANGTTDADGKFKLDNIPAGEYLVEAGGKGEPRGRGKVTVKSGEMASVTITVKEPKNAKGTGNAQ